MLAELLGTWHEGTRDIFIHMATTGGGFANGQEGCYIL